MSVARSVADVLRDHVVLEYEAIDRMYLNVYVPHLQTVGAMVGYLRVHRGQRFASTTAVAPMTEARYQLSILQAEFSLTQVLDQPVTGRIFFEEVIRENLDIGRPSQISLIFDRKITGRTPGRFRTRVITDGVVPSLHIDYKKSRIKQYHKLLEALRTETTINDTRDFGIGRRIENLAELRKIGFAANRRLLDVQRISHDCFIGEAAFQEMQKPVTVREQRAAALRFADPRVQGLLSCYCSSSSRAPSGIRTFASTLLHCWG
jgi:hypothetical protein